MRNLTVLAFVCCATAAQAQEDDIVADLSVGAGLYDQHCAVCHGLEARGDGPMAPALLVQPPDLTGLTARYDNTFPVMRVITRIDGRDPLVSHGSDMPVYGWFFEGGSVALKLPSGQPVLTSQPIIDLLAWIESIQEDGS